MKRAKYLAAAAFLAAAMLAGSAAAEDDRSQIDTSVSIRPGSHIAVVSKNVKGAFWKTLRQGMEDAVKDINEAYGFSRDQSITMTFEGAKDEMDVEKQINTLDAVIAENPDVLCLCASDMDSCRAQLEEAAENGIPVVTFDATVSDDRLVSSYIGTDNVALGRLAAEKLLEMLDGKGRIAVFSEQRKTSSIQGRIEGFLSCMEAEEGITVLDVVYQDEVEDMEAAMEAVLDENPELSAVFCTNADVSDLYLNLIKGREDTPLFVGTDATPEQQAALKEGIEAGCVSQDPYRIGYETLLTAAAYTQPPDAAVFPEKEQLFEPRWIDAEGFSDPENESYLYK